MAGPYTDDNDTLVKLMKLFNPLYHMYGEQLNREATLEMSKTLVTNAATEFFGPQMWVLFSSELLTLLSDYIPNYVCECVLAIKCGILSDNLSL